MCAGGAYDTTHLGNQPTGGYVVVKFLKKFWRWVSNFETFASISSVAGLTWSTIFAMVTALYAFLESVPGPYIVGLGAVAFAAVFTGLYHYSKWAGAVKIVGSMESSKEGNHDQLPVYPISTIDPMESVFREKTIHIADLLGSGMDRIQGKRFEKCRLMGPGVAFIQNASFEFCELPDVRKFWVYLTDKASYQGIFWFDRCVFERCELFKIDLAGTEEMRQHIINEVKGNGDG